MEFRGTGLESQPTADGVPQLPIIHVREIILRAVSNENDFNLLFST